MIVIYAVKIVRNDERAPDSTSGMEPIYARASTYFVACIAAGLTICKNGVCWRAVRVLHAAAKTRDTFTVECVCVGNAANFATNM